MGKENEKNELESINDAWFNDNGWNHGRCHDSYFIDVLTGRGHGADGVWYECVEYDDYTHGRADSHQPHVSIHLLTDRIVNTASHLGHVEDMLGNLSRHHISVIALGIASLKIENGIMAIFIYLPFMAFIRRFIYSFSPYISIDRRSVR